MSAIVGVSDLVAWALHQPIQSAERAGKYAQKLVLAVLCGHANADMVAYPAYSTLSAELGDMPVRDVRNCLDALEAQGLISRIDGKAPTGRTVRWRVITGAAVTTATPVDNPAVTAATHPAVNPAVNPAVITATEEKRRETQGRTCTRHASWNHDEPCRACAADRRTEETTTIHRPTSTMSERRIDCGPGKHRRFPDGSCMYCEHRELPEISEHAA